MGSEAILRVVGHRVGAGHGAARDCAQVRGIRSGEYSGTREGGTRIVLRGMC